MTRWKLFTKTCTNFLLLYRWLSASRLTSVSLPVKAWYLPSVPKKPWRCRQQPPAHITTPGSPLHQDRATGEAGDLRNGPSNSTSLLFLRSTRLTSDLPSHWLILNKIHASESDIAALTLTWFAHLCWGPLRFLLQHLRHFWATLHTKGPCRLLPSCRGDVFLCCPLRWISEWLTLMSWTHHHWAASGCQNDGNPQSYEVFERFCIKALGKMIS